MRISDWSSDVCSSDLIIEEIGRYVGPGEIERIDRAFLAAKAQFALEQRIAARDIAEKGILGHRDQLERVASAQAQRVDRGAPRSEERRVGNECVSTVRSRGSPDY